ncbi:MAG TPA: PIN domain-containing protein [Sphingomicrobium sp.]|nr:PIN domain-containing protein [Sphingomicrobium sp.]
MTRVALDSNILAYLAGVSRSTEDETKIIETRSLIKRLAAHVSLVAPAQAIGELFVVLRRSGASANEARSIVIEFADAFGTSASESNSVLAAADLVVDHKLQFWDSLILTAAANAGCTLLLSEDMQSGFVTRGVTIVNPYSKPVHPKLVALQTGS